jgi:hypothetical protein
MYHPPTHTHTIRYTTFLQKAVSRLLSVLRHPVVCARLFTNTVRYDNPETLKVHVATNGICTLGSERICFPILKPDHRTVRLTPAKPWKLANLLT